MENLTPAQLLIYIKLKLNPGMFHVTPDGNYIYILTEVDGVEGMLTFERLSDGQSFADLNEEELNVLIQEYLEQLNS
jgi:hypothetical protein